LAASSPLFQQVRREVSVLARIDVLRMFQSDGFISVVTRGLDPRVHPFCKKMD
jgi:hypothetical protein